MLSNNIYNTILQSTQNPNTINYYYLPQQQQQPQQQYFHHKHYSPTHTLMPVLQTNLKLNTTKNINNQQPSKVAAITHHHHQTTQIPIQITNDKNISKQTKVKDLIAKHNANTNIPQIVTNNKTEVNKVSVEKPTNDKLVLETAIKKEKNNLNEIKPFIKSEPMKNDNLKTNKIATLQTATVSAGLTSNKNEVDLNNKVSIPATTQEKPNDNSIKVVNNNTTNTNKVVLPSNVSLETPAPKHTTNLTAANTRITATTTIPVNVAATSIPMNKTNNPQITTNNTNTNTKIAENVITSVPTVFKEITIDTKKSNEIQQKHELSMPRLAAANLIQSTMNITRVQSNVNNNQVSMNLTIPAISTPTITTETTNINPNAQVTLTSLVKKPRFKTMHVEPNVVREAAARNELLLNRNQMPSIKNLQIGNESLSNNQPKTIEKVANDLNVKTNTDNNDSKNHIILISGNKVNNLSAKNLKQNENFNQQQQQQQVKRNDIMNDFSIAEKEINAYYNNNLNNIHKSSTKTYDSSNSLKSSINSIISNISTTQNINQKPLENSIEKQLSQEQITLKQQQQSLKNNNANQAVQSTSDYSSFNSQLSNNFNKVSLNTVENGLVAPPPPPQNNPITIANTEILKNKSFTTEKPKEIIQQKQQQQQNEPPKQLELPQNRNVLESELNNINNSPKTNERLKILPIQLNKLENRKNYDESDYKKYIDHLKLIKANKQNANNASPHQSRQKRTDRTTAHNSNSPSTCKSPIRVIKLNNITRKNRQPSNPPLIKIQNKNTGQQRTEIDTNTKKNELTTATNNADVTISTATSNTNNNYDHNINSKENKNTDVVVNRDIIFIQNKNIQRTENTPVSTENCILTSKLENVQIIKDSNLENCNVDTLKSQNTTENNNNNKNMKQDVNIRIKTQADVETDSKSIESNNCDNKKELINFIQVTPDHVANQNSASNKIITVQEKPVKVSQLPPPPPTITPRNSTSNSNSNTNATQIKSSENVSTQNTKHVSISPIKRETLNDNGINNQISNNNNNKVGKNNANIITNIVNDIIEEKIKNLAKIEKQQEIKEEKKVETVKQIPKPIEKPRIQSHITDIKLPPNLIKNIEKTIEKQQNIPINNNQIQIMQQKIGTLYAPNRKHRQPLLNQEIPHLRQYQVDSAGTTLSTFEEPSNPYTNRVNLPSIDGIDYFYKNKHDNKINISNYLNIPQNQSLSSPYFAEFNNLLSGKPTSIQWTPLVQPIKHCDKSSSLPWMNKFQGKNKNFYQNYVEENNKRMKDGDSFLMLLPGIAIPIETDIVDSDEESGHK